jgi:hypothetical protein
MHRPRRPLTLKNRITRYPISNIDLYTATGAGGRTDEGVYPTGQASFFMKFTNGCLFRRFIAFHKTTGQAPHALVSGPHAV